MPHDPVVPGTGPDAFDRAIVEALQQRGDIPDVEPARAVALSPAATLRRVTRLR